MTTGNANEVALGVEPFGHTRTLACSRGTTMLSWPDALCRRLVSPARVVRTTCG